MRIISGRARGRKLLSPPTYDTRPTLDRVKEAMFNILQFKVRDAIVLDMFAGSGSLGLESVSRGAKTCYLIDKSPTTFPMLKQNIENLKFQEECICLNMDAYAALKDFKRKGIIFDVIFIDPPYRKEMIPEAMEKIEEDELLKKDGIIMTKIDTIEEIYEGSSKIKLYDHRKYGNTTVCLYKYKED